MSGRNRLNPGRNGGISLVELLIVVTVLGVMAMLAYPNMKLSLDDARLNAAAGEVAAALSYAQLQSLNTGLPARVEFKTGADTVKVEQYQLPHEISENLPDIAETVVEGGTFEVADHPLDPGAPYQLALAGNGLFGGVDVTGADFSGGDKVTFNALGSPSDGGSVTLVCGGNQRIVKIDALTGSVTITH